MDENGTNDLAASPHERLRLIEERLLRIETYLRLPSEKVDSELADADRSSADQSRVDAFEIELSQNWFAKIGVVVAGATGAFALTFPYPGLPSWLPGAGAMVIAAVLYGLAGLTRDSFVLLSRYLRGSALVLLYCGILRFAFFTDSPLLAPESSTEVLLLLCVTVLTGFLSLRRGSAPLFALSLAMGAGTLLIADSLPITLPGLFLLVLGIVIVARRFGWHPVVMYGMVLIYIAHLLWTLNNPLLGHPATAAHTPAWSALALLMYAAGFAVGMLFRKDRSEEDAMVISSAIINAVLGYGMFLVLSLAAFGASAVFLNICACCVFLAFAVAFWLREESSYSTFFYAMLGYMALSVSLLKLYTLPSLFVWLSIQSIFVVATAIWFRSRFIIVANFIIFLAVIFGYVVSTSQESGFILVFGVTGLVSARILNWQRDRLSLKTDLMRNAYLAAALVVLPYAVYHILPREFVALGWIGIAMLYYLMNVLISNQKYRWMGHFTLLLSILYVVLFGLGDVAPVFRIVSLLVLGITLTTVSLIFARMRARKRAGRQSPPEAP